MEEKKLLKTIVESLVEYPKDVEILRTVDDRGVLLTLKVNDKDIPTIIGKEGKFAKALRCILRTFGSKSNARISLKIATPNENQPGFSLRPTL